jgi:hypothetical protein
MHARSSFVSVLAFLLPLFAAENAHALATFELETTDPAGVGFNDTTPASPVGGNMGTTVGQQRRLAFEYALGLWGNVLESPVPIRVSISFQPLLCTADSGVLGQAGPTSSEFDVPGGDPNLIYPEALADQLAGEDLQPGLPDIQGEFNGSLMECFGIDWYYGFDTKHSRDAVDLVSVVLHEVAHGLGFLPLVDPETGDEIAPGYSDPFSTHLLDLGTDKHWDVMTAAERRDSSTSVRGLVWDGRFVTEAASTWLTPGAPHISVMPAVQGFEDVALDGNFGPRVTTPITGTVARAMPSAGCDAITATAGSIAVAPGENCHPMNIVYTAEDAGAIAVLLTDPRNPPGNLDVPAEDLDAVPLGIPAFAISAKNAEILLAAAGATVTLSATATQRVGTDSEGHVYIYASSPIEPASTAAHWDTGLRPDPIQKPADSPNTTHDITLERALFRDIGWATRCGNGMPDPGEECDNGATNSDTQPNACRMSCRSAFCGDGIVDTGEACDPGPGGSVDPMCGATCMPPVCGNGVVEGSEECDAGAMNSDTTPNACRTMCKRASCGDGVRDMSEECDAPGDASCVACRLLTTGTGGSAGLGGSAGAATGGKQPVGGSGGSGGTGGNDRDDDEKKNDDDGGGCLCRVGGHGRGGSGWVLLAALGVSALALRRRPHSAQGEAGFRIK